MSVVRGALVLDSELEIEYGIVGSRKVEAKERQDAHSLGLGSPAHVAFTVS